MMPILLFLNLKDVKCYKVIKIKNVKFNFPKHESKVKNWSNYRKFDVIFP